MDKICVRDFVKSGPTKEQLISVVVDEERAKLLGYAIFCDWGSGSCPYFVNADPKNKVRDNATREPDVRGGCEKQDGIILVDEVSTNESY